MGFLLWIIIGLVVSILTLLIEPYVIHKHILITIFLGVIGGFVGGAIASYLGFGHVKGMHFMIVVYSIGVSSFILTWYRAFEKFFTKKE